jgi:hypothetical protein
MFSYRRCVPLLVLGLVLTAFLPAAPETLPTPKGRSGPPAPPAPEQYGVTVRYLIQAARNERLRRFFRMMEDLRLAGFVRSADDFPSEVEPEDPKATRLRGDITARAIPRVLNQPDVQALLLYPQGKPLPGKETPVRINLRLAGNLPLLKQRNLHGEARQALAVLGFAEAVGYDHQGYTRILGQAPAGQLTVLLDDLRRQPAAWSLLPKSLLGDLRKEPGGTDVVDRVIDQWASNPAGKKLVNAHVLLWQAFPAATAYMRTLPLSVTEEPIGLLEVQTRHFARHPESAELLGKLFDEVRKDAAAPELMDTLLTTIEGAGLTSGLPILFRAAPPVRIIEAQPEWPLPTIPVPPPEIPKGLEKFSPEFRAVFTNPDEAMKARRFDVLLTDPLPERERTWTDRYAHLPVTIEGRLGSIVTVYGAPAVAEQIVALPGVMNVRLPVKANEARDPTMELKCDGSCPGKPSLMRQYVDAGRFRQVVLIGADFRDWESYKGQGLPAATRMLDLTRERNRNLQPDPFPGDPKETGLATKAALALVRMAGTTELVLVRVDPEAAYQVDYVARLTNGDPDVSLTMLARLRDLGGERRELEARGQALLEERTRVLTDFRPESEKLREEYRKHQAEFDRDRQEFDAREKRYLAHESLTDAVRRMRVVWNTLTWDEGYPLFGTGTISRFLDDGPFRGVWLQSRGPSPCRVWYDMWRDEDRSGSLDLLPAAEPLPPGRWSPDLGFLTWAPERGEVLPDLPADAVVRLVVQWREVHDADLVRLGVDFYKEPLARVALQVFQQLDPKGEKRPADDLALIVQSSGTPVRVLNSPRFAVYEQAVEFKVPQAGRYLVRIEGTPPESIRPRGLPTIPAAREVGEMHPRVVVRTLTGGGTVLLENATPARPAPPMPADSLRAVGLGVR